LKGAGKSGVWRVKKGFKKNFIFILQEPESLLPLQPAGDRAGRGEQKSEGNEACESGKKSVTLTPRRREKEGQRK